MIDEKWIIAQVKAGDYDIFCQLVEKYKGKALGIAYSLCTNYEDAKDLSQEAFIKAFKKIRHFKEDSQFYTWFYRILVNVCRDYLRRKTRNKMVNQIMRFRKKEGVFKAEDIFESVPSSTPDSKQLLLNKELGAQLTGAINSLPEKQRTVFTLKHIHDLNIREIAEILCCAQGTIKAHLFKASVNLQNKLLAYVMAERGTR